MAARIQDVPGLVDLYQGSRAARPSCAFRIDAARAARLGMTATDVTADLDAAIARQDRVHDPPPRSPDRRARALPRRDPLRPAEIAKLPLADGRGGRHRASAAIADASSDRLAEHAGAREPAPGVIVTADHEDRDSARSRATCERRLRGLRAAGGLRAGARRTVPGPARDLPRARARPRLGLLAVLAVLLGAFRRAASRWSCCCRAARGGRGAGRRCGSPATPLERVVADGLRAAGRAGGQERHPAAGAGRRSGTRRAARGGAASTAARDPRASDPDDHAGDRRRPRAARARHRRGRRGPAAARPSPSSAACVISAGVSLLVTPSLVGLCRPRRSS